MNAFPWIAFVLATIYVWRLKPCAIRGCMEWSFPCLGYVCQAHAHRESVAILKEMVGA